MFSLLSAALLLCVRHFLQIIVPEQVPAARNETKARSGAVRRPAACFPSPIPQPFWTSSVCIQPWWLPAPA
jgi:hypothetical protein